MATWHQEQARKRPGFKLFHETKWTVLHDPPGDMASGMLFATYTEAQGYLSRLSPDRQQHTLILRPDKLTWVEVDEARYDDMLNILPPAFWQWYGFLVGEAWDHDPITYLSRFAAFVRFGGKFYEGTLPMTIAEFRDLDVRSIGS